MSMRFQDSLDFVAMFLHEFQEFVSRSCTHGLSHRFELKDGINDNSSESLRIGNDILP